MKMESVKIKSGKYNLSGTIIKPDYNKKVPAVVFYHGMISQSKPRHLERALKLSEKGIGSLVFDLRGVGGSDGKLGTLSLKDFLDDSLLAFDFLYNQDFVDKDRVGICAHSFGGGNAPLIASERKVKSMVLQAPAVYEDNWFEKPFDWSDKTTESRRKYRFSDRALDNKYIRAIEKYKGDLLVVGCELDDTCPPKIIQGYFDHAGSKNKKLEWLKGADHSLRNPGVNETYTKIMIDWFTETL
ncbi:MAG: alpha/beta fold hydrolase [Patescibacteria group bacterium]